MLKPGDRFRLNTEGDSRKTNVRTCEQMVEDWAAKRLQSAADGGREPSEGGTEEITLLIATTKIPQETVRQFDPGNEFASLVW